MFELSEQDLHLDWSNEYRVGEALIDQQHQQMFDLYNRLVVLFVNQHPFSDFLLAIAELLQASEQHFRDEERLMEAAGALDLDEHRRKHADLMVELQALTASLDYRQEAPQIQVMVLFRDWVLTHMLSEDIKLRPLWSANPQR